MQPVDPRIAAQRPTGCCSAGLLGCWTRSPLYLIGDAASRRGLSRVGYFITLNGPLNGHPPSLYNSYWWMLCWALAEDGAFHRVFSGNICFLITLYITQHIRVSLSSSYSLCQGRGTAHNFVTASTDSLFHPPLSLVFFFQSSSSPAFFTSHTVLPSQP